MLLTFLAALAVPVVGPCGPVAQRSACPEMQAARAEADLETVAKALPGAIAAIGAEMDRPVEDVAAWRKAASEVVGLWTAYRDARCDPDLLRYEMGRAGTQGCRLRIDRAAASDLRFRYQLAGAGFARRDVETAGAATRRSPEDEGPCADTPPAGCDYCGVNDCWNARLKADDARLNDAWRRALARIAAKPRLSAAARADWAGRLRLAQRLWLRWRDANCDLERLETPNPYAHSITSLVIGPCLTQETEARAAVLARSYR